MNILPLPLSFFVQNLTLKRPFSFARYGDGEWLCITGAQGKNCDGVEYTVALGKALAQTLQTRGDYFYAMGPKASSNTTLGPRVERWLSRNAPHVIWYDSEALLSASLEGSLYPFVNALKERRVMLVGGEHLRNLPALKPDIHIVPPPTDAFAVIDRLEQNILKRAARVDVILFAAGPCAKVMIHDLHKSLGKTHTLLDVGSLFDVFCGKDSRRYARKMDAAQKQWLLERNFYG